MNEDLRDPITEWTEAIRKRIQMIVIVLLMTAFVLCMFAPMFGPCIHQLKRREFSMYKNYEELAENAMKPVRRLLWTISIVAWSIFIYFVTHPSDSYPR